jgi:peptidylprolyl isomerase
MIKSRSMAKKIILPTICAILIVSGIWFLNSNRDKSNQDKLSNKYVPEYNIKNLDGTVETDTGEPITNSGTGITSDDIQAMKATFETNYGNITIEFNPNTPKTVENFVKLSKSGFYDGTKFHRVIKDFMNQGGDPFSKDDALVERWGTGGPGYQFADEITSSNRNSAGTIAMANAGPNTNGSQFFINVKDNNFLDSKHTVFGKVVQGLEVVKLINTVATDANDRPLQPVIVKKVTIE